VDDPISKQYIYALFISTSHLFCLGYGLGTMPGTYVELCVTYVSMTVGSILFLVVVGTLPTAVLEQEVSAAAQELDGAHVPLPTARYASAVLRFNKAVLRDDMSKKSDAMDARCSEHKSTLEIEGSCIHASVYYIDSVVVEYGRHCAIL
jgi:hypothetical protein